MKLGARPETARQAGVGAKELLTEAVSSQFISSARKQSEKCWNWNVDFLFLVALIINICLKGRKSNESSSVKIASLEHVNEENKQPSSNVCLSGIIATFIDFESNPEMSESSRS